MRKSIFYYKELTPAEVGQTGTHEIYVRLPNNFDYKTFFHQDAVENGSVLEINFLALDITNGRLDAGIEQFRFVYFANSNKEKRLPGLGPLFKKYDIKSGDIFFLESREENGKLSFEFKFIEKGSITLQPSQIYFSDEYEDEIEFEKSTLIEKSLPLQQIFYGAPGTGKSHTIKTVTNAQPKENVFRTTFHPDSDYSTFVGCYKPAMKPTGVTLASGEKEEVIAYKFVPQAFTNAYLRAWQTPEPVYLVIEEINRGNCAQIFGDLFQLLDRENGRSEYPIKPDADLGRFIADNLTNPVDDIPDEVREGKELSLPANLHIWATMNTSDQSLFPIDSAFKRRWEWRYLKIKDMGKGYQIEADGKKYDWWKFVEKMNGIIGEATSSEDKKLGYFFAKPDKADNVVAADQFVSKVLFYVYGDALKDYQIKDDAFKKSNDGDKMTYYEFSDFYNESGKVEESVVAAILDKFVGPEPTPTETNETEQP